MLKITTAQLQALEDVALDEFCARAVTAMFGAVEAARPQNRAHMREIVLALRARGVTAEEDVAQVAAAVWTSGAARLGRPDAAEILADAERPDWLRAMQVVKVVEASRG